MISLRKENDELRERLRELSEQLMLQDVSNDMESFILDKSFSQIGNVSQFGSRISYAPHQSVKMSSPVKSRRNWRGMRSHNELNGKIRDLSADVATSKRNSRGAKGALLEEGSMPLKRKSRLKGSNGHKNKKIETTSIHQSGSGEGNISSVKKGNGLHLKFINSKKGNI